MHLGFGSRFYGSRPSGVECTVDTDCECPTAMRCPVRKSDRPERIYVPEDGECSGHGERSRLQLLLN